MYTHSMTASPCCTSHVIPFSFSSVSMKPQFALTIARILVGPPSFCCYLALSCKVRFNDWSCGKIHSQKLSGIWQRIILPYPSLPRQEIIPGRLKPPFWTAPSHLTSSDHQKMPRGTFKQIAALRVSSRMAPFTSFLEPFSHAEKMSSCEAITFSHRTNGLLRLLDIYNG